MRIVHGRPRYIVACGPRVNGKLPGAPSRSSYVQPRSSRCFGVYVTSSGMPLMVFGSRSRSSDSGYLTGAMASGLPRIASPGPRGLPSSGMGGSWLRPTPKQFGNYSILDHIATGGMAEVYLARQGGMQGFEKTVVIKRAKPELMADPMLIKAFLDEA